MAIVKNVARRSRNAREKIPTKKEISQDETPVKDEMPEIVYTMEDLDREYAESMEEMARGETFVCYTKKDSDALLDKWEAEAVKRKNNATKI